MESEHVVNIDLSERKNRGVEMSIRHFLGVEGIKENFEVACKIWCAVLHFD